MDTKGPTPEAVKSLTIIGALADKREGLEIAIEAHVAIARAQGASWRMVGVALGTSTQAAWTKYSGHQRDSEIEEQDTLPL